MVEGLELEVGVPGGTIFAKVWTPSECGSSEPLLLLHDSLGCVGLWRDLPPVLAERFGRRVVAYDRLGFGRSSARVELPSSNFVAEEAESVHLLLDALSIPKAALFGYSVGGSMALCAAAALGDRIACVISESAQAFVEPKTLEGLETARRLFANAAQVDKLRRWHGDKSEWILRAWLNLWLSPAMAQWSLAPILPRVTCPVLAIHGDRDDYGSFEFPLMITRTVSGPSSMLLLDDCGHMPHRERPEEVLPAMEKFLNEGR